MSFGAITAKRNSKWQGKGLYIMLILALVLSPFVQQLATAAAPLPQTNVGTVLDARQVELVPEVEYTWYDMEMERGLQKMHVVEFDPTNEDLQLQAGTSGGKVRGFRTLTGMAEDIDEPGNRVIAGVNGDFYEVATGIPQGLFMSDGEIWSTPLSNGRYAFGITADGRSVYGRPHQLLQKEIGINGETYTIDHINRPRSNNELVLYTDKFYTSTQTNSTGDEVILTIVSGDVKSGETLVMEVAEIRQNQGNAPLTEGQVVLSASGTARDVFTGLSPGDQVEASFLFDSPWDEVVMAIGGSGMLVEDGEAKTGVSPAGVHPRTAIGTKADGSIVLFEIDGRQPGFSEGVENEELAEILRDIGVENAMNLDGGGSSTFIARMPGEAGARMLNSGSDGRERNNANGLLLVSKAQETGVAEELVISPSFERVLSGSSFTFEAAAVDGNGHAATFNDTLTWSADAEIGVMTNGQFTAAEQAGTGEVRVSGAGLQGLAAVEVVEELTALRLETAEMAVMPGETVRLNITALRNGQVIQADPARFDWSVEGEIGTVNNEGVFTAADTDAVAGKVKVSYRDVETEMSINVGLPPVVVEDFDGYSEGASFSDRYLNVSGATYVSVNADLETNLDYVRSGENSLRLDYDFRGTTGTSGVYLTARNADSRLEVPGYPQKLSMWVYGDGQGHWLRAQFRDGSGAAFPVDLTGSDPGVNWVGWRYVEANIPQNRPLPLTMDQPVRYMQTSNDRKTDGTIYVDDIRVMYGPVEEDRTPPNVRDIYPEENGTIETNMPTIQAFAEDDQYDSEVHTANTLINPDRIRLYVDGERVEHSFYALTGQINYTPDEALDDGIHHVKLAVRDFSENETIREWQFNVDTGAAKFRYETPETVYAGQTYTVDIAGDDVEKLSGGHLEFRFDPDQTEGWSVSNGSMLTADEVSATVNEETGQVRVEFEDLETQNLDDDDILAQITYRVKADAEGTNVITYVSGSMRQVGAAAPQNYAGLSLESRIAHELRLEWDEQYALGQTTTFEVTDENGRPVAGAALYGNGQRVGDASLVTDENGVLSTDLLTEAVVEHRLQAVEGQRHSPVYSFEVSELRGDPAPYNISIAMGADPTSERRFNWNTHPDTDQTVLELVKTEDFVSFEAGNIKVYQGTSYTYNTTLHGTIRVHKADADDLEPGTEYTYRVGDGEDHYSDIGTFTTAPADSNETSFLVFGDSQAGTLAGYKLWGETVDAAVEEYPESEFFVHLGDMVDHGHNEQQWEWWFETAQEHLLNTTTVTVVGNHEVTGTRMNEDYLAHYNNPAGYPNPALDGTVFSFDYNNIHFVVLNSEYDFEAQREWLREDLAKNEQPWTVAIFHRGPYGSTYVTRAVQDYWVPVFDEFGVDLVLNGHDHMYLRTHPMKDGEPVQEGEGTTYLIPGGTGDKFYGLNPYPWQRVTDNEQIQMYAAVEVSEDELHVVTRTVDGRIVDEFTLNPLDKSAPEADAPEKVELNRTEVDLQVGESFQFVATVLPDHAADKRVIWSVSESSVEGVISVSEDGQVTALADGEARVRATSAADSDVYAEARIRVVEQAPEQFARLSGDAQVESGEEFTLTYGLEGIQGQIAAHDVTIRFDADLLTFAGFAETAEKDGFNILSYELNDGVLRFVAADLSEDGNASNAALQKLSFRANETASLVTADIILDHALVSGLDSVETRIPGMTHTVTILTGAESELSDLIAEARALHDAAEEGTRPGEYRAGAKAALNTAIEAAQQIAGDSSATAADIQQAIEELTQAIQLFRNAVNPPRTGGGGGSSRPIPSDPEPETPEQDDKNQGRFSIGDLEEIIGGYGFTSDHPDWEEHYAHLDFNGDGVFGLEDLVYIARQLLINES